ncbi:FIP1[V]-like protein isoform X1 [Cynara cardunculus var. scolymus]|uniref:FIP1[V]-like protein isoform X1 n=1 Tax=Cynara cardunculus var. scolymus TaxID=59895 RepID=UPI000D629D13|nr:FIP1[V]-like protein isoform X1 [Cynara cardunculus var. scolymus]XP_024980686.1 FIP1[V]-like protein isoform X1 [Cynara cardunculus var. scolymus]XP_024980687.1 FIP1[V]-like protein isoform X1 [Cynara cardunculus var. scolymus]XP_024980688.1 FIP1[V]-like protein isoform X1 [Cynara cardunculus var. scolymus]
MEDDDEFGDLYTDVLQPLQMSSASPQPQIRSTPQPPTRSIDLNDRISSDDEEILYGAKTSGKLKFDQPDSNLNLNKRDGAAEKKESVWGEEAAPAADSGGRVFGSSSGLVKAEEKGLEQDPNFVHDVKGEFSQIKEEALEENFGIEDAGEEEEFLIPGLSSSGARVLERSGKEGEGGDDWDDSDSEDDLQIVLNDTTGAGMMGMDGGGGQDEEDDEDGDNLVIVAGNADANHLHHHPPMEELQDWGEDASQAAEGGGERKDLLGGDAGKPEGGGVGGAVVAQKVGYGSHGYHPFHSQFKYVRPGAAPMPGAGAVATGGTPGQVRPPASMLPFAGRGRGEWRPAGIKNVPPMQKNFHPGYGMQGWGNNGAGRGFGSGLDFTLPSHKTIFEVDIDGFEEKPWRLQGIDISDFFNFGMNEESWKEYCKQLEQHRLEATMQSKIRVYESGRTEQEYDPDLPPELAAAAGIHDISSENRNIGKTDLQSDLAKGSARSRMHLPTGKAIQVETGFGERLPSIDTRPPRVRDSDAIIEIVLQGSADDESVPENDGAEQPEDVPSKENPRANLEIADDIGSEDDHFDRPQAYNGRKRDVSGRRAPFMGSMHDMTSTGDRGSRFKETEVEDHFESRGRTSSYPKKLSPHNLVERPAKRTAADRSPHLTDSGTLQDPKFVDNQKEESTESVGHKKTPSSSPPTLGSAEDRSFDQNDAIKDEAVVADGISGMEREGQGLDTTAIDTFKEENSRRTMKKQKLIARAEHSSVERGEDREDSKAGRSSENSKAKSGSSRDQQNMRDSMEQEVIQAGGSMCSGNIRRSINEDERTVRSRGREERQERERHPTALKGMEDQYSHRKWDSSLGHRSHVKSENFDRKKGRDSEEVWQDEDPHVGRMRIEDMRKRSHEEEMASRHRHKVRENERSDKNEHRSRKVLENGGWKGDHDRDVVFQQKRDDSLKTRHNISDGMHSKRSNEELHARRGDRAEREEPLHAHRESTSRRKRERDDNLDQHKRDEQARLKDDDQHPFRYKEEGRLQREKVERQRERDDWKERDGHRGVGSGRPAEDKAWVGHSRLKEDYRSSDKEYQFKDTVREQLSRRDRVENEGISRHRGREDAYTHGNKLNNEEKISRHERGYAGTDRTASTKDMHGLQEKKHKESLRKGKETDGIHNSLAASRRNREENSSQRSERASSRGMLEQRSGEQNLLTRRSLKKHKENGSSEDEQQESRKGRSKLERWTSHKDRDFNLGIKADPKEIDRSNDNGVAMKLAEESSRPQETVDNSKPLAEEKDSSSIKTEDAKPAEDKHLDTVEKLKKRSERFKLPMPSEKEAIAIKKMENEPLPCVQPETRPDSEVKPERPARKRRWTSG